jgi:putative PIN family toxin of toxin-antitoxin system
MKRTVLDTNVIVSALISPFGNEAQVLQAVERGYIVPRFSGSILAEYAEVLARPKFSFAPDEIASLLGLLQSKGLLFEPVPVPGVSSDPADDDFIACALAAHAEFLVTGNKRHFSAASCGLTKVFSARELIEFLNQGLV